MPDILILACRLPSMTLINIHSFNVPRIEGDLFPEFKISIFVKDDVNTFITPNRCRSRWEFKSSRPTGCGTASSCADSFMPVVFWLLAGPVDEQDDRSFNGLIRTENDVLWHWMGNRPVANQLSINGARYLPSTTSTCLMCDESQYSKALFV